MSRNLRVLIAASLGGALLLLGLAYPRVVAQAIVLPVATALWLLLRVFVLSIDQRIFWWGAVAAAAVAISVALLRRPGAGDLSREAVSILPADPSRRWRDSIRLNIHLQPQHDALRRDLAWMLTSLYASHRPGFAPYQVREALAARQIPLPDRVYDFLFSAVTRRGPRPPLFRDPRTWIRMTAESVRSVLRGAVRRRGGREAAEYVESLADVIAFMETSLEMHHELEPDS